MKVPLEYALQLQVFLTCLEGPRGDLFPPEIYKQVDKTVWADGPPSKAVNMQPTKVNLKEGAWAPQKQQHPLKEALEGIQPTWQKFLKSELIQPCQSPYNTPILLVKKPL